MLLTSLMFLCEASITNISSLQSKEPEYEKRKEEKRTFTTLDTEINAINDAIKEQDKKILTGVREPEKIKKDIIKLAKKHELEIIGDPTGEKAKNLKTTIKDFNRLNDLFRQKRDILLFPLSSLRWIGNILAGEGTGDIKESDLPNGMWEKLKLSQTPDK